MTTLEFAALRGIFWLTIGYLIGRASFRLHQLFRATRPLRYVRPRVRR